MRIALEKVDFLPPDRVTDGTSILTLKNLVLEPMLSWRSGRPAPGLFESWKMSPDGRRWRLRLRAGAIWHDGQSVRADTAAAFLNAIMAARDMFGMPWSYGRYLAGARIDADATTLIVETPDPFPDLPDILSEFYLPRAESSGHWTLGTGPWRVEMFSPGASVSLRHNDGRLLTCMEIPEAEDRRHALLSGQVDAAHHLETLDPPIRGMEGFSWIEQPVTLSVMAYLNGAVGAFRDHTMRLAANLAVDRERLIAEVMGGQGLAARTIVSPWHTGFAEAELSPLPCDPSAARALVAASRGPRSVLLRSPNFMPERAPQIAEFVGRAWREIGLEVEVDLAGDRPGYAREVGAKRMGDAALFDSSPHSTFRVLDDKISSVTRAMWWQGVVDAEADRLFTAARHTPDPKARAQGYGAVLRRLQAAPPWLYLFHPVVAAAYRTETAAVALDAKGILRIGGAP